MFSFDGALSTALEGLSWRGGVSFLYHYIKIHPLTLWCHCARAAPPLMAMAGRGYKMFSWCAQERYIYFQKGVMRGTFPRSHQRIYLAHHEMQRHTERDALVAGVKCKSTPQLHSKNMKQEKNLSLICGCRVIIRKLNAPPNPNSPSPAIQTTMNRVLICSAQP